MKKTLLAISIAAMLLTACGESTPSGQASTASQETTASAPSTEQTAADVEAKKKADEEAAKQKAAEEAKAKALAEKSKYADMVKTMLPNLLESKPELPAATYDFIVENNKLFPAKTPADIAKAKKIADKSITAKHLNKNATPYLSKIVTFAGQVVNVEEVPVNGETVSSIHILDNNMQSYQVLMLKSTGDLLQGDSARFWGVPAGPSSFSNVSGGTTNVQLFVGAHVEKQGK